MSYVAGLISNPEIQIMSLILHATASLTPGLRRLVSQSVRVSLCCMIVGTGTRNCVQVSWLFSMYDFHTVVFS